MLAVAIFSANVIAQTAAEPPVICAALTSLRPERLIQSCTALIDDPATPDADRTTP